MREEEEAKDSIAGAKVQQRDRQRKRAEARAAAAEAQWVAHRKAGVSAGASAGGSAPESPRFEIEEAEQRPAEASPRAATGHAVDAAARISRRGGYSRRRGRAHADGTSNRAAAVDGRAPAASDGYDA